MALGLKGVFDTLATGKEKGQDINVFCFPMRKGAWALRRYTQGCAESDGWEQDGTGWTRCYFNMIPDLKIACRTYKGVEHPSGGFVFADGHTATAAARLLGVELGLPPWLINRSTKLKQSKDGRLVAELSHESTDKSDGLDGWLADGKLWKRIFTTRAPAQVEPDIASYDDYLRHVVSEDGVDMGWLVNIDGRWNDEPLTHVKHYLEGRGMSAAECKQVLGTGVARCWSIVNRPFEPEYLGDRQWNREAAQLRFLPNKDKDILDYPSWSSILSHIGSSLDEPIRQHQWCIENGILKGADFLKLWIASLFQEPRQPLPYLFLYGEQGSGKSILHEAIELLMTKGVVRADTALTSSSGFFGELEHALLCVVEETDLKRNKAAYNKIKDWVTSRMLPLHVKNATPIMIPNTTHWIQCANNQDACPIFPGDSRIIVINVPMHKNSIPKREFIVSLEKEAPDFLAEILRITLPRSNDRLNLPVLMTQDKQDIEEGNRSYIGQFINECCFIEPGHSMLLSDFDHKFKEWLPPEIHHQWSKIRIGKELKQIAGIVKGRDINRFNQVMVGNLSFTKVESTLKPWISKGDYIEVEK